MQPVIILPVRILPVIVVLVSYRPCIEAHASQQPTGHA